MSNILCSLVDCGKPNFSSGLCSKHHARWKRHGSHFVVLARRSIDDENGQRLCRDCEVWLPLNRFHKNKKGRLGHVSICPPCSRQRAAEYRNSEAARALRRESSAKRKALIRAGQASGPSITVAALRETLGDNCYLCQQEMIFDTPGDAFISKRASVEHVVPLSRGGKHEWGNVKLACLICNIKKGTMTEEEYTIDTSQRR